MILRDLVHAEQSSFTDVCDVGLQTNKLRFIEQVIARLPSEVKGILGHDDYDLGYPHVKANSKLMDKTFACMTPYLKLRRHRPIYCKGLTHTSWYDACEIQVSQGSRFCKLIALNRRGTREVDV